MKPRQRHLMTNTTEFHIEPHTATDIYDFELSKKIADKLNEHYPGHLWAVNVNSDQNQGVCNIFNFAISKRYGYVLHVSTIERDTTLKCVVKAGGEILERASFMRGEAKGEYAKHVDGLKDRHQPTKAGIIQ